MTVQFRLLGGVEAYRDDQPLDIGHARQQCVLAALLVEANAMVSADQLIDRVWGEQQSPRARNTLHTYLTRLRQSLAAAPEVTIVRRSGSYQLTVDRQAVDLHRFRDLIKQARSADDDQAMAHFETAFGLWRGEPFAGLDTPWLAGLRATLEDERLAAELDHTDVALRHGRHADLLPALSARVIARPLDERLTGQLMLALYRTGRQADALQAFRDARRNLADELGIDPGPQLTELHARILKADPSLVEPVRLPTPVRPPVPRQLPAAPRLFTGRTHELDLLTAALDSDTEPGATLVISAIGGVGGVGKTWLALHWAHNNVARFPDGQLHVNLRGFDPTGEPMRPATAIRRFLDALAVDPTAIPLDPEAQAGLFRSLVADKRMLIVLDNARDTNQVIPLLPGSPTNTVLITSRNKLSGLIATHGARPLALDVLADLEARDLLKRHLGAARLDAEPVAVEELLRHCAGLPLALGIAAGRAATQPELSLAVLADELRDHIGRLDALDTGETDVNLRAVFSWSYDALSPLAANLFALLGLAPGPDIGLPAVASLAARPPAPVKALLRELETANLIQQHLPGRYRMHDLIRLYASERATGDVSVHQRETALRRLVDHYTHTAFAGDRLLDPHREAVAIGRPSSGCHPHPLSDETAAWAWFDTEHPNLLAIHHLADEHGWHPQVWRLAWTLDTLHHRRGHHYDWLAVWRAGLAAGQHLQDRTVQAMAHRRIGHAYTRIGRHDESVEHLEQALVLAEQTGNATDQGLAHHALALAWAQNGDDQRSLEHATCALRIHQAAGRSVWESSELNQVGLCEARLGRYEPARSHCEAALALARRHGYGTGEAGALDSLGYIAHHTGQHRQAVDYYNQAVALFRSIGDAYEQANILDRLGQAHAAAAQYEQARDAWQRALDLYQAQHSAADAERIRHHLATLEKTVATVTHRPGEASLATP